jgi:carboxymethylenebutenolidase
MMGTTVSFNRADGKPLQGYLAEPVNAAGAAAAGVAGVRAAGVVVIQEWWGVNGQIRGVADRLADAGYVALVPDLYRGKSTVEAEEAHHLMTGLNFGDAASQDIRGAVQYLKTRSGKVGVTGFCMGGALTLLTACAAPEIDAAVVWYGAPPLEYIDATKIKAPLQGHWATQDEFFPVATIDQLQDKLRAADVSFDFHRYLAHHAFANETAVGPGRIPGTQYDPVWSRLAWDRTFRFLGHWLG